jgi:predicted O-methyltransferase YrrM
VRATLAICANLFTDMSNVDLNEVIAVLAASPARSEVAALLAPQDEWAVSLGMAALLSGLVKHVAPQSVLEFGAGRSSLVLASALQACGGGRLTSIEHQPRYAEQSWRRMTQFPVVDANLVHARLSVRFSKHGLLHEYVGIDDALRLRGPFGFVFIDAPPGERGRDTTLLQAAPFLSDGAIVVLDDARRPREQTAMRRWARAVSIDRIYESDTLGRGVAVLQIRRAAAPAFSWRTFAGTIHDRIVERKYRQDCNASG